MSRFENVPVITPTQFATKLLCVLTKCLSKYSQTTITETKNKLVADLKYTWETTRKSAKAANPSNSAMCLHVNRKQAPITLPKTVGLTKRLKPKQYLVRTEIKSYPHQNLYNDNLD